MADNVTLPAAGTGDTNPVVATDQIGGTVHYQRMKMSDGTADSVVHLNVVAEDAASAGGEAGILAMGVRKDAFASLAGTDGDFVYPIYDSTGKQWVHPIGDSVTLTTDVTRAANTTTYAINDNVGSTPSGGYTITGAARVSGGSGIITDIWFTFEEDAATPLQLEMQIFDSSFTEVADNAAYVVSDAEAKTQIAAIAAALSDNGNQGVCHVQGLSIGFTTVGSADLRFAIKAKNAYVPTTNSSILSVRMKILQVN